MLSSWTLTGDKQTLLQTCEILYCLSGVYACMSSKCPDQTSPLIKVLKLCLALTVGITF